MKYVKRYAVWVGAITFIMLAFIMPAIQVQSNSQPLAYKNLPFPVQSPVRAGAVLHVTVERCNRTSGPLSYSFTRELRRYENNRVVEAIAIPGDQATMYTVGCEVFISRLNVLPPDLQPGTYKIFAFAIISGGTKPQSIPWETDYFEVIE